MLPPVFRFSLWFWFSFATIAFSRVSLCFVQAHITQRTGDFWKRDQGLSIPPNVLANFQSSSWIWTPEPDPNNSPAQRVAFLKSFDSPAEKTATSALILMTVDNQFTLWVNGQPIGASPNTSMGWQTAQKLTAVLNGTTNVFAVLAVNTPPDSGTGYNPAGLLATIQILYSDGTSGLLSSDSSWSATTNIPVNFQFSSNSSHFNPVAVLAQYGSGPWGSDVVVAPADPNPLTLSGSSWIWSNDEISSLSVPAELRAFQKVFTSQSGKVAQNATILMSADNSYSLYVNGDLVGSPPPDFHFAQRFFVDLLAYTNVFAVLADNTFDPATGGPGAAGLVAAIQVMYTDGTNEIVRSDRTWLVSSNTDGFTHLTNDTSFTASHEVEEYGIQPWGTLFIVDSLSAIPLTNASSAVAYTDTPSNTASPVSIPQATVTKSPNTAPVGVAVHPIVVLVIGIFAIFLV